MEEINKPIGILLCRVTGSTSTDADISKCILCQKVIKEKTTTTMERRQKILAASELRKDDVLERINLLGRDSDFVYHCSNACYKSYTLKKTMLMKKEKLKPQSRKENQMKTHLEN